MHSGAWSISVVVPLYNEAGCVAGVVSEIVEVLRTNAAVAQFEIVCVDDGSTDGTLQRLGALRAIYPELKVVSHRENCGQSAALCSGVRAARHALVVTLDGDGQNDPHDIAAALAAFSSPTDDPVRLVIGHRVTRRDSWLRRLSSRVANSVRRRIVGDDTPDTGCGLKLFERSTFLALPFFDHMHRFLPALVMRQGGRVVSVPVNHRARTHGVSKYGVHNRLWVGLVDLLGVVWLKRRAAPAWFWMEGEK